MHTKWAILWLLLHVAVGLSEVLPSMHDTLTIGAPGERTSFSCVSRVANQNDEANFVAIWDSDTNAIRAEVFRISKGRSITRGGFFTISNRPGQILCEKPRAAPTATGFIVAWSAATTVPGCGVMVKQYSVQNLISTPHGSSVELNPKLLHPTYPEGVRPEVAVCGTGIVVAWTAYTNASFPPRSMAYAAWLDNQLGVVGSAIPIGEQRQGTKEPAVACLHHDVWVVVYASGDGQLYQQVFNGTKPISDPTLVSPSPSADYPQSRPSISQVSNSSFLLTWDDSYSKALYRMVHLPSSFGPIKIASDTNGDTQSYPHVTTLDNSCMAVIVWGQQNSVARIVSTVDSALVLGPVTNITASAVPSMMPDVAALDGRYFAATYVALGVPYVRMGKANSLPVALQSLPTQFWNSGQPFEFSHPLPLFRDPDGDPLTILATRAGGQRLPAWLQYERDFGCFSGQHEGSVSMEVFLTANDGYDNTTISFRLMLQSPPKLLQRIGNQTVVAGRMLLISLAQVFIDADGPFSLDVSVTGLSPTPPWIFIQGTNLTCAPPRDAAGSVFNVIITAWDGYFNTSTSFWLHAEANHAPVVQYPLRLQFGPPHFSRTKLLSFTFVEGTFFDEDGDALSYRAQLAGNHCLPRWLVFIAASRTFVGDSEYMTDDSVVVAVTASDGLDEVTDLFGISLYYPSASTTLMVAAVLSVSLVVIIVLGLWFYTRKQRAATRDPFLDSPPAESDTTPPRAATASRLPRGEPCASPLSEPPSAEELELQQYFEKEYPDLIDPITGEVMHDPVVTSAGHSYSRRGLLKHLELRCTDPLTNLPLNLEKPFEPNHTLKKVVDTVVTKWKDDRNHVTHLVIPPPDRQSSLAPSVPPEPFRDDPHVPDGASEHSDVEKLSP